MTRRQPKVIYFSKKPIMNEGDTSIDSDYFLEPEEENKKVNLPQENKIPNISSYFNKINNESNSPNKISVYLTNTSNDTDMTLHKPNNLKLIGQSKLKGNKNNYRYNGIDNTRKKRKEKIDNEKEEEESEENGEIILCNYNSEDESPSEKDNIYDPTRKENNNNNKKDNQENNNKENNIELLHQKRKHTLLNLTKQNKIFQKFLCIGIDTSGLYTLENDELNELLLNPRITYNYPYNNEERQLE